MPDVDPAAYGDAIADVYDDWYADVSDVGGTVELVTRLAGGGPVLELGIGTGRLAIPLRGAGVDVHGIDASPAMVERLRSKPGGDAVPVTVGDFGASLPAVPDGFAVVLAAFNTFLNLTTADAQRRCLALVAGALRPGGALVVEAFVPASDPPLSGVDVRHVEPGQVVLSVFRRADGGEAVSGSLVSITEAGIRLRPWAVRPTSPEELDGMAAEAGFAVERRDGGWRGEPFDARADRHVTVFRLTSGTVDAVSRS